MVFSQLCRIIDVLKNSTNEVMTKSNARDEVIVLVFFI
jgi:hypothetical protein